MMDVSWDVVLLHVMFMSDGASGGRCLWPLVCAGACLVCETVIEVTVSPREWLVSRAHTQEEQLLLIKDSCSNSCENLMWQ